MTSDLPVIVIGAGPVGLAAAAHLATRGLRPFVLERGASVGTALRDWGHVRIFSPWRYNTDHAARSLLAQTDWTEPDAEILPTGSEIVSRYLEPLAAHPALAPHLVFRATVVGITRAGLDKMTSSGREGRPFVVRWRDAEGTEWSSPAVAVIDASGTWGRPNPMGADGLPVAGEAAASGRITYGIPDVLDGQRDVYADRRILVVGGGHSAMNVVLDLLSLKERAPGTHVVWALRRNRIDRLLGGGINDQLPARGTLGIAARRAIEDRRLEVLAPFTAARIERHADGILVHGHLDGLPETVAADRVVVATGSRPDLDVLRELRVALDPAVEAPPALAPLIDPNLHSCGSVPPHGARELAHPEPGFYIVGSKAYGRAPTFLMMTGYEQVRSVVAEIAGDHEAARQVRLVLPETGVCTTTSLAGDAAGGCCGGPAPPDANACCLADADAKAAGEQGCGCSDAAQRPPMPQPTACCGAAA